MSGLPLLHIFPKHSRYQVIVIEILFDHRLNGLLQFIRFCVLQQEGMNTHFHHMKDEFFAIMHGQHNQLHVRIFTDDMLAGLGAIHHGRPCARYLYSQFCTFAPLVRNHSWDEVKKQLYKVHLPHLKAGYIERVEHEALVDDAGQADWALFYTPGKKAYAEYAAFTGERKRRPRLPRSGEVGKPVLDPSPQQLRLPGVDAALVEELVASELNRADAERLVADKTQECRRQLEYLPFVKEFTTSKGAYLRRAIEQGWGPPPAYAEHLEQEEKRQRQARQQETQSTRKAAENARRATIISEGLRWVECLEKDAPEAFSGFVEEEARGRGAYIKGLSGSLARESMLAYYNSPEQRLLRLVDHFSRNHCPVPELAAWLQEHPVKKLKSLLSS